MNYTKRQKQMLKLKNKLAKKLDGVYFIDCSLREENIIILIYKQWKLKYIYDGKDLIYKPYTLRRRVLHNPTNDAVEDYLLGQFKNKLNTLVINSYDRYLTDRFKNIKKCIYI